MSKPALSNADRPVERALILLCEKCGKKLASDDDDNPARALQKALKSAFSDHGEKSEFRCVISSCLKLCPVGRVTCAVVPMSTKRASAPEFFELNVDDIDRALHSVLETVRRL